MTITSIDEFLSYYDKVKGRTLRIVECIPEQHIEWTFKAGKFTLGDIVRHLALLEQQMFAENVQQRKSRYQSYGEEHASGKEAVIELYKASYEHCRKVYAALSNDQLMQKAETPAGVPITTWKWLRAMLEHEIHHRAQIYTYLAMLNVTTPPLYGLTAEQVADRSASPSQHKGH